MPRSARLIRAACAALFALLLAASPAAAGVSQVRLKLPLKPRLPLRGNEKIALAPFIIVTEAERARDKRLANVDLQAEFHRFLKKQVDKKTKLEVIETPPDLKLPTQNLAPGVSGSMTVAHDGSYGDLAGKAVAVEPSTGLSFDHPMVPRFR